MSNCRTKCALYLAAYRIPFRYEEVVISCLFSSEIWAFRHSYSAVLGTQSVKALLHVEDIIWTHNSIMCSRPWVQIRWFDSQTLTEHFWKFKPTAWIPHRVLFAPQSESATATLRRRTDTDALWRKWNHVWNPRCGFEFSALFWTFVLSFRFVLSYLLIYF